MIERKKIKTFYLLYKLIVDDSRVRGKEMALALGRSGRGQTISSATRQLDDMYRLKVSFKPRLVLNNYKDYETKAFFCRKSGRHGGSSIYWKLYNKKLKSEISSAFYLAGNYDYFVTTRKEPINLESIGLEICETTNFYDPIFTIPNGWKHSMKDCTKKFLEYDFIKGKLPRKCHGTLNWEDLHWKIYLSIRTDLRKPFKHVERDSGVSSYAIKKNLFDVVVPCCTIANYFFPYGYDSYDKIFIKIQSEYEKSIVSALKYLPCTTYVYPLENDTILIIFHEGIKDILMLTKKMEEMDLFEDLLLSVPLASVF